MSERHPASQRFLFCTTSMIPAVAPLLSPSPRLPLLLLLPQHPAPPLRPALCKLPALGAAGEWARRVGAARAVAAAAASRPSGRPSCMPLVQFTLKAARVCFDLVAPAKACHSMAASGVRACLPRAHRLLAGLQQHQPVRAVAGSRQYARRLSSSAPPRRTGQLGGGLVGGRGLGGGPGPRQHWLFALPSWRIARKSEEELEAAVLAGAESGARFPFKVGLRRLLLLPACGVLHGFPRHAPPEPLLPIPHHRTSLRWRKARLLARSRSSPPSRRS